MLLRRASNDRRQQIDRQRQDHGRSADAKQKPVISAALGEEKGKTIGRHRLTQRETNGRMAPSRLLLRGMVRKQFVDPAKDQGNGPSDEGADYKA